MAEDDAYRIKAGGLRGTRYPGFSSGPVNVGGNVSTVAQTANPNDGGVGPTLGGSGAETGLGAQKFSSAGPSLGSPVTEAMVSKVYDIPRPPSMTKLAQKAGGALAGGAATYGLSTIGK